MSAESAYEFLEPILKEMESAERRKLAELLKNGAEGFQEKEKVEQMLG